MAIPPCKITLCNKPTNTSSFIQREFWVLIYDLEPSDYTPIPSAAPCKGLGIGTKVMGNVALLLFVRRLINQY